MTVKHEMKYRAGDHKVICDTCGFTYMRTDCRLNWRNLLQCRECFDPKHPQLIVKGKTDKQTVDITRPEDESDTGLNFGEGSSSDL